jgi:endo-1,4-beta-xylanase
MQRNHNIPKKTAYLLIPVLFLAQFSGCRQFDIKKTGTADVSLYKKFAPYFTFGAAVAPRHLNSVNEAVSDTHGKSYRDAGEGSEWYRIFGNEEYIYWAFKYAGDALAAAGSPTKLHYNDYNVTVPSKLSKILAMVKWLLSKGIRIDGIGLQGHWRLDRPSAGDIKNIINRISRAGLEVKISELDISVYTKDNQSAQTWEAEKTISEELERRQALRYRDLFNLFRANSNRITSVTLWGVSDDATWLDTWPVRRNNYPLLFDDNHKPKLAYYAIVDF